MNASFPPFDNVSRSKFGEVFEPEAGCLCLTMTKLPRLDDLVRLTNVAGDDGDGVFDSDARDVCKHELADKLKSFVLFSTLSMKPTSTGNSEVGARWVGDHKVPITGLLQKSEDVRLDVVGIAIFGGEEVTRKSFMTEVPEGSPDNARKLTGNKHSHNQAGTLP